MNRRDFLGWVDTAETWPEYVKRQQRRERWQRRAGYVSAVVLALLLMWVSVHVALGPIP